MASIRKVLGRVSIAALTLSAVAETSALASPADLGGNADWVVPLALIVGCIWLAAKLFKTKVEREKTERTLDVIRKTMEPIAAEFPFLFASHRETNVTTLCMDRDGERLRFLEFNLDGMKTDDIIVHISTIISVELSGGDEVVNDYETTSTKPDALAAAIVGGLLFGRTGAIVGATAAGSERRP